MVQPMQITLLGTGNPIPDPNRAGPSTLVRAAGATVLIDCGRGVLQRMMAAGAMPPLLGAVLITHLHSDHLTDLNDVITMHWVMSPMPMTLKIYGPPRTREVVDAILASLAPDIQYRLDHHDDLTQGPMVEVIEVAPGDEFSIGALSAIVGATDHRPVQTTVAFRLEDGTHSVVLGGDGLPCDGLHALCLGADAYVQTVIREDLVKMVPSQRFQDILDYHSTVDQAAQTATRAGVRTLVLTHYVPAIAPGAEDEWRALAAAHFTGDIVLGDDLTSVEL